jgi:signal recognition particle subunit SRP54
MGNIGQLASMIPGLNSNLITKDKEKESTAKIQRFLTAMDSMNKDELDGIKPLCDGRIKRIARGAGVHVSEIHFLINEHKKFGGMVKGLGGMMGGLGGMGGKGGGMPDMEHVSKF